MDENYKATACPQCGKKFYPKRYLMKWGYLNPKGEPVCSYSCQRASEKNPKYSNNKQRILVPVRIVETGEEFDSISKCAAHLNVQPSNLYYCIHKGREYRGLHIERVTG